MSRACSTNGEEDFGGRAQNQLARPRRRWENNIKKDLKRGRMGCGLIWLMIWTSGEPL
jgi:hypothetical protein